MKWVAPSDCCTVRSSESFQLTAESSETDTPAGSARTVCGKLLDYCVFNDLYNVFPTASVV
jgi:hypothetical protein